MIFASRFWFACSLFLFLVLLPWLLLAGLCPTVDDAQRFFLRWCCFCLHLARLFEKWFAKRFSFCVVLHWCFWNMYVFFSLLLYHVNVILKIRNLSVLACFPRMSKKRSPAWPAPLLVSTGVVRQRASLARRCSRFWNFLFLVCVKFCDQIFFFVFIIWETVFVFAHSRVNVSILFALR